MKAANENHIYLTIKENGLFIDQCHPYVGATPDGMVICTCCGEFILEVKCPHSVKQSFPEDNDHSFCTEKGSNGNWTLKQEHSYYYQVQTQMHVCNVDFCDFIVWSECDGLLIHRVYRDTTFFNDIIESLQHLFVYGILPEIVGKWYSRKPAANLNNAVVAPDPPPEDDQDTEDYDKVWCYCKQPCHGGMIYCDHELCQIKWFHCDCLRIRKIPKGSWKCPSFRKLPGSKKKASKNSKRLKKSS